VQTKGPKIKCCRKAQSDSPFIRRWCELYKRRLSLRKILVVRFFIGRQIERHFGTPISLYSGPCPYPPGSGGSGYNFGGSPDRRIATAATQVGTGANAWGQSYGYDAWANLQTATVTQGTAPALNVSVNSQNHITNPGFAYDAAGNLTSDGFTAYSWDAGGHLKSAGATTYTYDGTANGWRRAPASSTGMAVRVSPSPKPTWPATTRWSSGPTTFALDFSATAPVKPRFFSSTYRGQRQQLAAAHTLDASHSYL